MKYPNIITVNRVMSFAGQVSANNTKLPDGRWVPARPLGYPSIASRLRATWLVFTGRADAVLWEGQ